MAANKAGGARRLRRHEPVASGDSRLHDGPRAADPDDSSTQSQSSRARDIAHRGIPHPFTMQ